MAAMDDICAKFGVELIAQVIFLSEHGQTHIQTKCD